MPTPYTVFTGPHPGGWPAAKGPADYTRAVFRRIWLVLGVTLLVGLLSSLFVLRMKDVYRAQAQIVIESPQFDQTLGSLLTHQNIGGETAKTEARYLANRLVDLRAGGWPTRRSTTRRSIRRPRLGRPRPGIDGQSPAQGPPPVHRVDLTLDGPDPPPGQPAPRPPDLHFQQDLDEQVGKINSYTQGVHKRLKAMHDEFRDEDAKLELVARTTSSSSATGTSARSSCASSTRWLCRKSRAWRNSRPTAPNASCSRSSACPVRSRSGDERLAELERLKKLRAAAPIQSPTRQGCPRRYLILALKQELEQILAEMAPDPGQVAGPRARSPTSTARSPRRRAATSSRSASRSGRSKASSATPPRNSRST